MNYLVRPVCENDAAAIVALLNPIIRAGGLTIMTTPFSPAEQAAFIRGLPARGSYLAALRPPSLELVGIQDILPLDESEPALRHVGVVSTFVSQSAARSGVGTNLCQASFARARELGFLKICATVRADNPAAQAFYRRQGFNQTGIARRHAYVEGRFVDEVYLERWIG